MTMLPSPPLAASRARLGGLLRPAIRPRARLAFALASVMFSGLACSAGAAAGGPVRPLADDFVVVGESPDPKSIALYTPSIERLPSGRLAASYSYTNRPKKVGESYLLTSDDHGLSWTRRAKSPTNQGRLFTAGNVLYYLAVRYVANPGNNPRGAPLCIQASRDNGVTWTEPSDLRSEGVWHQTAANVWQANGNVYLVMERDTKGNISTWRVGSLAPILMRAKATDDLTRPEAWRYASEITFQDVVPGYVENDMKTDLFGVPFYKTSFPAATPLGHGQNFPPPGWLECNVVQILDPNHIWHDPTGHTFHLFLRAHTGLTNYAAIAQVKEKPDGSMETELVKAPSGKTLLFIPFPGGQMRFHVLYDQQTRLYWMLGSQTTDSMVRMDRMPNERYGRPDNERHRMVLHFSTNMIDWCFAGVVSIGPSPKQARHYASMAFDGDDLVVLSRSADSRAPNAHDGNLITLHRVKDFRALVY